MITVFFSVLKGGVPNLPALALQKSTPSETPTVNKLEGKLTPSKDHKPSHANKCSRCDGKHNSSKCRFKDAKCHACGKVGHIS